MEQINYGIYYNQVSCIDRQIAELQARRNALLSGICFTGYPVISETYVDEEENERDAIKIERRSPRYSKDCGGNRYLK